MAHQLPPDAPWRTWVILGGRGAGKTRAGSEWVRAQACARSIGPDNRPLRIGLIAETYEQAREVMVFGDSGIMSVCAKDEKPHWIATRKMLIWPNGTIAQLFSASDPEALRGPQFDAVWADELAKWKKADETWDMLQFALRLGNNPRACVTTTPRNVPMLRKLLARDNTVMTHAPTQANRANLADSFLAEMQERYGGTRLGQQELEGAMLADVEGALWTPAQLTGLNIDAHPPLDRVVVAVDPPATSKASSDLCGIIVAGVCTQGPPVDWRAYVIADVSVSAASPAQWAGAAIAAMDHYGAERLVAEVNQGGEMVEAVLRQVDPLVSFRAVRAAVGKSARAEPIAALYEQGRVSHLHGLSDLEEQMCQMTTRGFDGTGSPDRVDALVWALHDLVIEPARAWRRPRVRTL